MTILILQARTLKIPARAVPIPTVAEVNTRREQMMAEGNIV